MSSERERRYGAWGKHINGRFFAYVLILPGIIEPFLIESKLPIGKDRFSHLFYRKSNNFMKTVVTYHEETKDIKDLIIDLERAGFEFEPYS